MIILPLVIKTLVLHTIKQEEGTGVLGQLLVSMECNELLDMMYVDKNGRVSKRRIKVIQVEDQSFKAYCYLRQSKRTFTIDHVLALVPIIKRERDVV